MFLFIMNIIKSMYLLLPIPPGLSIIPTSWTISLVCSATELDCLYVLSFFQDYIKTLVAPTESITVNYPKEMHNVLINPTVLGKLEQQAKAIVMFSPGQRGELRILGCDTLSVTLALSAIEDLINIYLQEQTSDSGTAVFQTPSHRAKKRLNKELRRFSLDDSIIIISEEEFTYMNNAVKRTILGWLQENQDPQTPRRAANTRAGGSVPDSPDVIIVDTDLDDTVVQQTDCPDVSLSAMLQDSFHTPVNSPGGGSSTLCCCLKPPQPGTGAVHGTVTEIDPPCEPRNLLTCLAEEKDSLQDEPSKTHGHVPAVESPQKTQSAPLTWSAQPLPKPPAGSSTRSARSPLKVLNGTQTRSARSPLKVLNGPRTRSALLSQKAPGGTVIQSRKNATEYSADELKGSKRQKLSQQACEKQRSSQEKSSLDKSDDVIATKNIQKPPPAMSEKLKNNSAQLDGLSLVCTAQQNMLELSSMADTDRNTLGTERNLKRKATQLDDNSPALLESSATPALQHNSIAANTNSATDSDINSKLTASVQPNVATYIQPEVAASVQSKVAASDQPKGTTSIQSKVSTSVQPKVAASVESKVAASIQPKVTDCVQSKVAASVQPKVAASVQPKVADYVQPKVAASVQSKVADSVQPKVAASVQPKVAASIQPKVTASVQPKVAASVQPKVADTIQPKVADTIQPKVAASVQPKVAASVQPKVADTIQPKVAASVQPKVAASVQPKMAASVQLKVAASIQPKVAASIKPKVAASIKPKVAASVQPKVTASVQPNVAVCNQIKVAALNQTGSDEQVSEKLELIPSSVPLLKQQSASEKSRLRYIVIDGSNLAMS